jgi:hypothetical protein
MTGGSTVLNSLEFKCLRSYTLIRMKIVLLETGIATALAIKRVSKSVRWSLAMCVFLKLWLQEV